MDPETREEQYLDAIAEGDASGIPAQPITREEIYLDAIAKGNTTVPEPVSRKEQYLAHIAENGGGGGDITVESLSVTENGEYTAETGKAYSPVSVSVPQTTVESLSVNANGTYTAPTGKAYSPVSVSVPNSYTAGDEGKVVSNGALVAQTAHAEVTQNGTIDTTLNNSVVVNVSGGGGTEVPSRDVNFYDYDGTIVASYSAADFANLSALPSNPSHDGLTAQGWNWSLADAKTYVASYGMLDVGQMYVTSDGKTRVYCQFESGRLSPYLGLAPNGSVTIDWGDGSASDTLTGSDNVNTKVVQHNYASPGSYVITLTPSSGSTVAFRGSNTLGSDLFRRISNSQSNNRCYLSAVKKIHLGTSFVLGPSAFSGLYELEAISMPSYLTKLDYRVFQDCYGLPYVTVPNNVTNISGATFLNCRTLRALSLPNGITNYEASLFDGCYGGTRRIIPSNWTSIPNATFSNMQSLCGIVVPSGITSIGTNAFACNSIGRIKFAPTSPPTVSNSNAFSNVPTDCKIYVPTGSLSSYTGAANYPSSSSYTYVEY